MPHLRLLTALALAAPASSMASNMQADRYFAVQTVGDAPGSGEFVVRISETARAKAFAKAMQHGQPLRLTSRVVQRPAAWNTAWPFYTERHRLISTQALVSRCSSHGPGQVTLLIAGGANVHGSAWCPAVRVVREINPPAPR
ncbi:hypothetical protein [Luteibacter aegosomatissinici]|uniref:BP74-related protein n=1 Tax=Luteibacter aegosomatissinici TaxID=2911539 RepID=UPI001FF99218|nr:hypothetical protein [Luteibacter aegosomatissinici]UPG94386.1 hypothetical protein L2Y97_21635 [Luteibacter aegosomatissinici]